MLTSLSTEELIPADHPIRRIRMVVDVVLAELDDDFEAMYSRIGRRSIPPESLLKATVLIAMYSIRSERAVCERLKYDLLFKWFLDMSIDAKAFDSTTFTKTRRRLLDAEFADRFFEAVVRPAKLGRYISSEHFSVDGTLLEAWASQKSFKQKDRPDDGGDEGPSGRNVEVDWKGEKRSNTTHESTTNPESRLARKSLNTAAQLCYSGHLLTENRSALIVDAELATADGFAERDTAEKMLGRLPRTTRRRTSERTRPTTPPASSRTSEISGSHPTSRRTRRADDQRSTPAPPDIPDTASANVGGRPGVTTTESAELRKAKRRIRLLEQENEVLRRAAAYLGQATLPKG